MASRAASAVKKASTKKTNRIVVSPKMTSGFYVTRDAKTGRFISNKEIRIGAGITLDEIKLFAPSLRKLAEYDRKGKK